MCVNTDVTLPYNTDTQTPDVKQATWIPQTACIMCYEVSKTGTILAPLTFLPSVTVEVTL